jgi:hypothetical protein
MVTYTAKFVIKKTVAYNAAFAIGATILQWNNISDVPESIANIDTLLSNKVDNVTFTNYQNVVSTDLSNKVDKITGKALSTNDFTNDDKSKIDTIVTNGTGTKSLRDDGTYKEGSGGISSYNELEDKPSINNVTLSGNKTSAELGLQLSFEYTPENEANKVTSLLSTSTDNQYPSAKCMYDIIYIKDATYEKLANKVTTISFSSTDNQYPTAKCMYDLINSNDSHYEKLSNKVTTISSGSTDTQYPTAKCMYDLIGSISSAIDTINGESV